MEGGNSLICLEDVCVEFQGRDRSTAALQQVSLRVDAQEFVSVLGPSGCGKTTVIRLITGTTQPTRGRVVLSEAFSAKNSLGVVFQSPLLLPFRTAFENVRLPLEIHGVEGHESGNLAEEALALVGLSNFRGHLPRQLSGGMQQRVSIARAIVANPLLLAMDEPFSALDAITRETLQMELLRIWRQTQKTIVFVTHSIDEAVFLSDRVIVLSHGPGTVKEVIEIDLPRPRDDHTRGSFEFATYCARIRSVLKR